PVNIPKYNVIISFVNTLCGRAVWVKKTSPQSTRMVAAGTLVRDYDFHPAVQSFAVHRLIVGDWVAGARALGGDALGICPVAIDQDLPYRCGTAFAELLVLFGIAGRVGVS